MEPLKSGACSEGSRRTPVSSSLICRGPVRAWNPPRQALRTSTATAAGCRFGTGLSILSSAIRSSSTWEGRTPRRGFSQEIRRTGQGYWVQTPNRYFPIETHLLTPFVHLLPRAWRAFIVRRATVWQWIHRPGAEEKRFYIEHFVSDIRLLSAGEMQRLFPDAVILRERFLRIYGK